MYLRKKTRKKEGQRYSYWELVESVRTERGPRQRIVAHIGDVEESLREGIRQAAQGKGREYTEDLFENAPVEWVEVNPTQVRVERVKEFGGVWLGWEMAKKLELPEYLSELLPAGREEIPWHLMSLILVLFRLAHPSSELEIAENLYERSAAADLLGVPEGKVNKDRLYRALDQLIPQKEYLEKYLKEKLGDLFALDYDVILYDITSTYFEGLAEKNPLAQRGYSRDHRPDCKQVCIALMVSREGIPFGYELLAGNTADVTTVEEMVEKIEKKYGKAKRIWVMDRGMMSQENMEFMKEENRQYIVGTPRSQLKAFEKDLMEGDWQSIREGVEVKLCPSPEGEEVFILCRSVQRQKKEQAIHERFEKRMEVGLNKLHQQSQTKKLSPFTLERRVGRLCEKNSRISGLYEIQVQTSGEGRGSLSWRKNEEWREWAQLTEGSYLLRTNIREWSAEDLWKAYIQLTEAETAFRIQKSELGLRPVWHQKEQRVAAHILVCFLAYVLYKTLGLVSQKAGLGNSARKVLGELSSIMMVDVILPTKQGVNIVKRCVAKPTKAQMILLQKLGLKIPESIEM
jgi:transposase